MDAGCFSQKGAGLLSATIKRSDLSRLTICPDIKPVYIDKPDFRFEELFFKSEEWLNNTPSAAGAFVATDVKDRCVLGELTIW
ncbi:MAG: hypothetical protein MJK04_26885 [Psychrosphaera sp.]|nr:hypothetical protein [Psychrosphaera sp.]